MLLEEAGCPQVLGLGSSVTNRTVVAELVVGEELPLASGSAKVQSVFSFGLNNARTTHLYAAWRHIHAHGCTPEVVFIEVLPGTLNGSRENPVLLMPFLDAVTSFKLPRGFAQEAGFDAAGILEAATWGRLALHRLREPLVNALLEASPLREFSALERPLPSDGMMRPLSLGKLSRKRFASERAERLRIASQGEYAVQPSRVQIEALKQLVSEVEDAGSRVVLHSPPVTSIYHEVVDQTRGHETFCRAREELLRLPSIEWHWAYDGAGYTPSHFMDWNHLNVVGGERYIRRLFAATRERRHPTETWCRARQGVDPMPRFEPPAARYPATDS
jgi:hypothetical protein